ncbi:hypothetical protein CACET_c05790 [Clostridium aceticum]|uniref:Sensor histidine kinase NatK-like C-terminal domain-containing protein n=1 Tax=Clostridium aceticum TaxID=84022 RepID=A0A0D8IH89_9CLOT|nr:GHKL domain-containing protein [Clostridium aceticum]AKL94089.1 hypothetical protein CACET_c05790 [Clostridium aceticum]KJF28546.1 hypothetical protein TZ02_01115 [Clostridium aceticum]
MLTIDNFRSIIVIAMEVLIYINVLRLFLKVPKNKYMKLYFSLFISGIAVVMIHSEMQYFYNFKTAVILMIQGLITIILLKTTILKTIFLLFICAVVTLLGNIFAIFIMMSILGVTMLEIQNDTKLFFTGNLITFATIALLLYIIKYILLYKTYGKTVQVKSKNIVLYIITVFSMLFINFYTFIYHANEMNVLVSVVHIILVVAYITISLNYTFLENDFYYQKILYQNQQEYLTVIENLLNGYRELKHGWKNYLTGFSGFIYGDEQDWEALIGYYESVVKKTKHLTKDCLTVLTKIKDYILLGMFIERINEAEAKEINVNINISGEEVKLGKDYDFQMDLNFMLGNFLDNAIRHAEEAEIPILWIEIVCEEEYTNFVIKNTFKKESMKAKQRFDGGHGLRLVTEKVKKYPFIVHSTIIDGDLFIQELIIEKQPMRSLA